MNVNNVYLCQLCTYVNSFDKESGKIQQKKYFIRTTLVKELIVFSDDFRYKDLFTGELYRCDEYENNMQYEIFVDSHYGFRSYKDIIPVEKQSMSKRKILKKYKEYTDEVKEKE